MYNFKDREFQAKLDKYEILTIYVGELNPSERNTKIISLDFNSGL